MATPSLQIQGAVEEGGSLTAFATSGSLRGVQWQVNVGTEQAPLWRDIYGANQTTFHVPADQSLVNAQIRAVGVVVPDGATRPVRYVGEAHTVANVDDAATADVTIVGDVHEGAVVDANVANLVDADGGASVTGYQWQRFDSASNQWVDIGGATDSQFVVPYGDAFHGAQVRVVVSTQDALGGTSAIVGAPQTVGLPGETAPLLAPHVDALVAGGDAALDALVDHLRADGVQTVEIDADQVSRLDDGSFTLSDGLDVTVVGTGFLNGGAAIGGANALLGEADVTVRLTDGNVGEILNHSDASLDSLLSALQAAGMDNLELTAGQVDQLLASPNGFDFESGVDVTVVGTGFLHGGAATGAASALLSEADVSVQLTPANLGQILGHSDASLDSLVNTLQAAGMDHLQLSAAQVTALAGSPEHFDFDGGTEITVVGTGFLNHGTAVGGADALLGDADVTVKLTQANLNQIVHDGDHAFDTLVQQLHEAGMDHLQLDAGQVAALDAAHFTLDAGTDVTVVGTGFLNAGSAGAIAGAHELLGAADVTVALTAQNFNNVLAHDNASLNSLVHELQSAGMDHLQLSASQVAALASDAHGFHFDAGTDVSVVGTGFLHHGDAASIAKAGALLGGADVSVSLTAQDLGHIVQHNDASLDALTGQLHNAGVDHLALDVFQAQELAQAMGGSLTLDGGLDVMLQGSGVVSVLAEGTGAELAQLGHLLGGSTDVTAQLDLEDLQQANISSLSELQQVIQHLDSNAPLAGVDHIEVSDELANALAEAHAGFLSGGADVLVHAQADIVDALGGKAYLEVSLADMANNHIDGIEVASDVHRLEVALRDSADNSTASLGFSLSDLPQLHVAAGTEVSLAVDGDDLAALLQSFGGNDGDLAATLHASGFTSLHVYDGTTLSSGLTAALGSAGLGIDTANLSAAEVKLLGLGADPATPAEQLDPFHKP